VAEYNARLAVLVPPQRRLLEDPELIERILVYVRAVCPAGGSRRSLRARHEAAPRCCDRVRCGVR
jgi:hypothetical protein